MEHDFELEGFFWNMVEILTSEDGGRVLSFLNKLRLFQTQCSCVDADWNMFSREVFGAQPAAATTTAKRVSGAQRVLARRAHGAVI